MRNENTLKESCEAYITNEINNKLLGSIMVLFIPYLFLVVSFQSYITFFSIMFGIFLFILVLSLHFQSDEHISSFEDKMDFIKLAIRANDRKKILTETEKELNELISTNKLLINTIICSYAIFFAVTITFWYLIEDIYFGVDICLVLIASVSFLYSLISSMLELKERLEGLLFYSQRYNK